MFLGAGGLFFPAFKVVLWEQFINIALAIDDFTFYLDKGNQPCVSPLLQGSQTNIQFFGNFIVRKKAFSVQVRLVMLDYRFNAIQHRIE